MDIRPQLSILIRVRSEGRALDRLLAEVRLQRFDWPYEIVVIDNESDDDSARVATAHGATVYTLPRAEFTYGRAINAGVLRCAADAVMLLSAHVWPFRPDSLPSLADFLRKRDDIDAAYCLQRPAQRIGVVEAERFAMFPEASCVIDQDAVRRRLAQGADLYRASYFSNSACVLRRSAVERHPMRDLPYAEENAFALDVLSGGRRVAYLDTASVYYEGPFSSTGLYHQARRQTIAARLIEHAYGSSFGVAVQGWRREFADVLRTPVAAAGIACRFVSEPRYGLDSRALQYDLCALHARRGRLVGALSWHRYLHTLDVDQASLTSRDSAISRVRARPLEEDRTGLVSIQTNESETTSEGRPSA